ncbi:amidohydrolase 2 [Ascobolus immersus RN42]|uniref:Amidohydrolase 2 n=1 Tax=Ascobolus immersus RN42 TaxID=1160509 RepID=A0A3N4HGI0_ASCIM|nr:amidohydrolase 2 [Ascobolus immersus RN42]
MSKVVDIHTHIYPPSYIRLLRSRQTVPYIRTIDASDRLVILPSEDTNASTSIGRPIGPEYYDISHKLKFMDVHNIDISILSLANPWLDFLPSDEAAKTAREVNDDIDKLCGERNGRLYAFGALPLSASVEEVCAEVERLKELKWMRGVVMGTGGIGKGLDDERLDKVWGILEETGQTVFLHPHYGLPSEVWGEKEYGHVLPLALGFPLETTIAISRMYLAGVFDRYPRLQVLLAHSGGTIPFLAGRLESCIEHDAHLQKEGAAPRKSIWDVLKRNILLDAVVYSEFGVKTAVQVSGGDRVLFGTDNPFFPPLAGDDGAVPDEWKSVTTNVAALQNAFGTLDGLTEKILGGNAVRIFNLA